MLPIVVMPEEMKQYAKSHRTYGGNITHSEIESLSHLLDRRPTKQIVCFIGGFCDTYYRLMWNAFCGSILHNGRVFRDGELNPSMLYMSFNCYEFLLDFIPRLTSEGREVSVISHSWGAKNILRSCLDSNIVLDGLVTLDCVGHFSITHRPSVGVWENIYITDYFSQYNRANLAAIIGGAKQSIKYADINTGMPPPAHHASVPTMLKRSQLVSLK